MELNDFKKPFNIFTIILAIVGISVGIYFYHLSKRYKEISYQIDQVASKIYDSKNATSLIRLTDRDSVPIAENVYYIRGKIWNSGNQSIQISDVRIPLSIKLGSCKRILDFKIEKQFEDSTQAFKLDLIKNNELKVDWTYFDPNNGFSFQVIYLGEESPKSILTGKILDIPKFKEVNSNNANSTYRYILILTFSFLFGWFADRLLPAIFGKKSKLNIIWRTVILIMFTSTIGIIISYAFSFLSQTSIPF